jgi:hypothetical protein
MILTGLLGKVCAGSVRDQQAKASKQAARTAKILFMRCGSRFFQLRQP